VQPPGEADTTAPGDYLEYRRMQSHALRIDRVIVALRTQACAYSGSCPPALDRCITDFERELATVESRLRESRWFDNQTSRAVCAD